MAATTGFQKISLPGGICPDVTTVNDSGSNPPQYSMGRHFYDAFGNKYMYQLAKYTTLKGDLTTISWVVANVFEGTIGFIAPTTATLDSFNGITMNVITSGNFGFVQVYGFGQVAIVTSGTINIGDSFKCSNGQVYAVQDAATGTAPAYSNYGRAIVAAASNAIASNGYFVFGTLKA